MNIINVTEARAKLYSLIDETASTHEPIVITGKRSNAILVSEEDWNALSETLYLYTNFSGRWQMFGVQGAASLIFN
jgi:prevent-host-death family protein